MFGKISDFVLGTWDWREATRKVRDQIDGFRVWDWLAQPAR